MKTKIFTTIILVGVSCLLSAQVINVPADQPTIQDAINYATNGDTVLVDEGIYYENINFIGKAITVGSHYIIDRNNSHIENTIIDGSQPADPDKASVVTFDSGEDTTSVICGFTITGGSGSVYSAYVVRAGGGIALNNSSAKIVHNHIQGNIIEASTDTVASGGAISAGPPGFDQYLYIAFNKIFDNYVYADEAWAIGGAIDSRFNAIIFKNHIYNNECNSQNDRAVSGAIYMVGDRLELQENTIENNRAISTATQAWGGAAGAIFVANSSGFMSKNSIIDNSVSSINYGQAGGIMLENVDPSFEVWCNCITGNHHTNGSGRGGGFYIHDGYGQGNGRIYRNLVVENSATYGGGFYLQDINGDEFQFFNNTMAYNSASTIGGGLYMSTNTPFDIINAVFWGNDAPISPQLQCVSNCINVSYSDVEGGYAGTGNINLPPMFLDPENGDFHIAENSPCIDVGDPDFPLDPDGTVCDMGRFCCHQGTLIQIPGQYLTIQEGIDAATDGDTVLVDQGTYYENIKYRGKAITVASNYINEPDSAHIYNTIINGSQAMNPNEASAVMFVNGEDTTSVISGFTITGGAGYYNTAYNAMHGAGVCIENSGAKIENNIITNNEIINEYISGGVGIGAIDLAGEKWLVVRNNLIYNNKATAGGMSAFGGGMASTLNSIVENNIIEYNECENIGGGQVDGGGIEIEQLSSSNPIVAYIKNNIVQHNELQGYQSMGAGMSMLHVSEVYVYDNDFTNNSSISEDNGFGGGIFCWDVAKTEIINNQINNNIVSGYRSYDAGICINKPIGSVLVKENIFTNNTCDAEYGSAGSALRIDTPIAETKVIGNTFESNTALGSEFSFAAFFLWDAMDVEVMVDRNLFKGNEARHGAGFYARNSNNLQLTNNIFQDNIATSNGGAIYLYELYSKGDPNHPFEIFSGNGVVPATTYKESTHASYSNNVFLNNQANLGGAIFCNVGEIYPIFFNSIYYGNFANLGEDIYNANATPFVVSYCNINTNHISGNYTGGNFINIDPLFIDDSCHIDISSQCIEAGTPSLVIDEEEYFCPDHDIDGDLRPLNNAPDIGVDEVLLTGFRDDFTKSPMNEFKFEIQPNPMVFNTTIKFTMPISGLVSLSVYNITGRPVETICLKEFQQGEQEITWNAMGLTHGLYFLTLETNGISETRKLVLLK
jgi:hypothetical protein